MTLGKAQRGHRADRACRRIIGPALPASLQNIRIQFVTPEDVASADRTAEGATSACGWTEFALGPPRLRGGTGL